MCVCAVTNRPDHWKDDMDADVDRRPGEGRDGRDKRDHMGQPTLISQVCAARWVCHAGRSQHLFEVAQWNSVSSQLGSQGFI